MPEFVPDDLPDGAQYSVIHSGQPLPDETTEQLNEMLASMVNQARHILSHEGRTDSDVMIMLTSMLEQQPGNAAATLAAWSTLIISAMIEELVQLRRGRPQTPDGILASLPDFSMTFEGTFDPQTLDDPQVRRLFGVDRSPLPRPGCDCPLCEVARTTSAPDQGEPGSDEPTPELVCVGCGRDWPCPERENAHGHEPVPREQVASRDKPQRVRCKCGCDQMVDPMFARDENGGLIGRGEVE